MSHIHIALGRYPGGASEKEMFQDVVVVVKEVVLC